MLSCRVRGIRSASGSRSARRLKGGIDALARHDCAHGLNVPDTGTDVESVLEWISAEILHHSRAGEFIESLPMEVLQDFESLGSVAFISAGTGLFIEEEAPSDIFVLLRGQVKLTINSGDGRRFILRIAHPGDFLGLTSAFAGNPHATTAEALYPCVIVSVRRSDFLEFLRRHPVAYPSLLRALSLECNQARARLRTIGLASSARAKFARLLLEWCADGRQTERGTRIRLSLSHREIAEFIGIARETVTRTLNEFKRRHMVDQCGSILMIPNLPALEEYASCGCEESRSKRRLRPNEMSGALAIPPGPATISPIMRGYSDSAMRGRLVS